ncbi:MAG: AAA family ATPase [Rhodocyclaceae bacterium]|nr:AAA family ATPase [Rhodocyclaceae bacterium]
MYLEYFGLKELPFGITPDTQFIYPSRSHREALNLLHCALASGEGFIKVIGEVGTGKTLLCRRFLAEIEESWQAAYVHNPMLDPRGFLHEVAAEIGLGDETPGGLGLLVKRINGRLLELAEAGKRVVLCIDEAQSMPPLTLECLRLLSNLETEKRKLITIVLFAQPELDERLREHRFRQLRQRISFHHRLDFLDRDEIRRYLEQRLRCAGYGGGIPLFTPWAVRSLARYSRGVPRLVNILAHKALLLAFGAGLPQARWREVRAAARDTLEMPARPFRWLAWGRTK